MLKVKNRTSGTHFTSLTENGKMKSFSGRDREDDHHFRQIFNVNVPKVHGGKEYQLEVGVTAWSQLLCQDQLDDGYKTLVQHLVFGGDGLEEEAVELSDEARTKFQLSVRMLF